jgi:hypothetical protein
MKLIEKIISSEPIRNYDFNGNPGRVITQKAEYVFNQYEEKPWVRFSSEKGVIHNPVRGTLKIDLRLKRVIFNS